VWCLGTGSPTIVLEAGGTRANMRDWGTDFPRELAAHTTVCTYSHYGADGNPPDGETLTFAGILSDADGVLAAMKAQAGINGPYVFVGWSFGGEVALGEVTEDLTRTAGFVILDTDLPRDFRVACAAAGRTPADCQAEFDGDREAKQLELAIVAGIKPIPRIPVALVSAMQPGPDCAPAPGASEVTYSMGGTPISAPDCVTLLQRIADEDLADWRAVAPQIVQTRVDADHDGLIQIAGPQIVDLIVAMLGLTP
jgi:thioesterase domain-containing protein